MERRAVRHFGDLREDSSSGAHDLAHRARATKPTIRCCQQQLARQARARSVRGIRGYRMVPRLSRLMRGTNPGEVLVLNLGTAVPR